jgi:hypothetical protein
MLARILPGIAAAHQCRSGIEFMHGRDHSPAMWANWTKRRLAAHSLP